MDPNKQKALDAALSQIERQFGKGTVMRMGDQERVAIPSISTGSLGLDIALGGRQGKRPSYLRKADGEFEAHLVALSCSEPPEGYSQWSLRLLADRAMELNYIDSVSHETVRRVLKKRN